MGKNVNQTELAEILGKSDVTIWEWQEQGLPIKKETAGRTGNEYDTAEVIQWLIDRALMRAGKTKAVLELESLELDVKEKRAKDALREKTLVPLAEVEPVWQSWVLTAATYMASRSSRLAGILEATPGLDGKRQILKKEDAEFLKKLGVDGDRMQAEVEALLSRLAEDEAAAFLKRISGNEQTIGRSQQEGLG